MREVHEGYYVNHVGKKSMVKILIRAGYYCRRVEEEEESFVKR